MCTALALLSRTGITASFGDDDGGRVLDARRNRAEHLAEPLATAAVVFGRGDFKHIAGGLTEDLNLASRQRKESSSFDALKAVPTQAGSACARGLRLLSDGRRRAHPTTTHRDAGAQGAGSAGHGHADALGVQLLYGRRVLLQDPGTLEYVGDGSDRNALRGTTAHNTMTVDGYGQSDPQDHSPGAG